MCRPVTCTVCGKTTWAGCGDHIAQVKAIVPADQWCDGQHTADEIAAAKPQGGLGGLFRR
jgi:hypothetical protein